MRIIGLADIHGCVDSLESGGRFCEDIRGADIVLVAGDITNFQGAAQAEQVISAVREYNPHLLAVPGNCDLPEVDEYLRQEELNLHCDCKFWDSYAFSGFGAILPCRRHNDLQTSEESFGICLSHIKQMAASGGDLIFVAHYPARNTKVDRDVGGSHRGSWPVRDFIEETQPLIALSGHIHDAAGVDRIGRTTLVNPGSLRDGSYAVLDLNEDGGIKVEIKRI